MSLSYTAAPTVKARPHRPYRSSRRHFRGRERAAVIRAMTAAKLRLNGTFTSLVAAATACGSNVGYVKAAITMLESENSTVAHRVLVGDVNLLGAARDASRLAGLVKAYREATAMDHVEFARVIGPETLFDKMVSPAI